MSPKIKGNIKTFYTTQLLITLSVCVAYIWALGLPFGPSRSVSND